MKKYTAGDYGSLTNPELVGCRGYKNAGSHIDPNAKNPDLLENLEVTIDDVSGISGVTIEIGASCVATYALPTDISSIVVNPTNPSGIKSSYKNITLKYNLLSTNGGAGSPGQGLPSLLSAFGKTRLDSCLTEGKNYMKVTVKDNARSDLDGSSYVPNTALLNYSTL